MLGYEENSLDLDNLTIDEICDNFDKKDEKELIDTIKDMVDIFKLCYKDNPDRKKVGSNAISGKSLEPARFVKMEGPNYSKSFGVFDSYGQEIVLNTKSANISKQLFNKLRDFDQDKIEALKAEVAKTGILIHEGNVFIVSPKKDEEKARKLFLNKQEVQEQE